MKKYTCKLVEIVKGNPDENYESTKEESLVESVETDDFADVLLFIRKHTQEKWFVRGCDLIRDNQLCYTSGEELQDDLYRTELSYEIRITESNRPLRESLKFFTNNALFLI
jgi:hypothetical protein